MGDQNTPAGAVQYFARETAPEGWLVADGREVSRIQYPDLFKAIRVKFGMGDGIDTFNLPDLRGEFIRGLDGGRGVDVGRQFGSRQTDAGRNVIGNMYGIPNVVRSNGDGAFVENNVWVTNVGLGSSSSAGNYTFDASRVWGAAHTATEFRPVNIALLPCIKY